MRTIRINEGDIVIFLKKQPSSLVPLISIEDSSGPLGLISRIYLEANSDTLIPKIEVDVASGITPEQFDSCSPGIKQSVEKTVLSFKTFTGIRVKSPLP